MPAPLPLTFDYAQTLAALKVDYPAGSLCEIRTFSDNFNYRKIGYFTDPRRAADAISELDCSEISGFYHTLNPPIPGCLGKANNCFVKALKDMGTKDTEIDYRHRLLVDIDAERPSHTSATDEEHEAAIKLAYRIDDYLHAYYGFPHASIVDSGNGAHLRWATNKLPNDELTTRSFKDFLYSLAGKFNTADPVKLKIDTTVFNASRVARLPGTTARKGFELIDQTRVHRLSKVLTPYDAFMVLTPEQIVAFTNANSPISSKGLNGHTPTFIYPEETKLYRVQEEAALKDLDAWVPILLAKFNPWRSGNGWRIDSEALGRPLEEAISIQPEGIKDFGVHDQGDPLEGRRTVLQLLRECLTLDSIQQASDLLNSALPGPTSDFDDLPPPVQPSVQSMALTSALMGTAPTPKLKPTSFLDIMKRDYIKPEYIVEGLLLERQWVNIFGYPKSGKSTWVRQLALCIAAGLDFMGHKCRVGRVVFVTYEEHEDELKDFLPTTLDWLLERQDRALTEAEREAVWGRIDIMSLASMMPTNNDTELDADRERIEAQNMILPRGELGIAALQKLSEDDTNIVLIIIDPLMELFEGNRLNKNPAIADRLEGQAIKRICSRSKAVVITVDHSNKFGGGAKASLQDVTTNSNSTAQKTATATTTIALYRGWKDAEDNEYALEVIKGRRISQERYLMYNEPVGWSLKHPDTEVSEIDTKAKRGAPKKYPLLEMEIFTLLSKFGELTIKEIMHKLNIANYQVVRLELLRMIDSRLVAVDRNSGHKWFLVSTLGTPQIPGLPDIL